MVMLLDYGELEALLKTSPKDIDGDAETLAGKYGLQHISGQDGEGNYFGIPWCEIDDDETGKQFKERIEKSIEKILNKQVKCGTHEKAWYNG